jgi:hypothetical protein
MARIAPGESALHAGMAVVRLAVLVGNHADELLAPHFGFKTAAYSAIAASRHRRMFRLADVDHRLFDERGGRAGLDASTAGYALRFKEGLHLSRRNPAPEAAPVDCEGKGSLDFLASANATIADDAFRRIIAEIGVRLVLLVGEVVGARIAVAHIAQPDVAGLCLQLAIAVSGAGEAIERMIGDVKLHHTLAQRFQALSLGADHHARRDRGGARGGGSGAALDLDQTEAAGAERFEHVVGAEFWDLGPNLHRRPHDGRAFRHSHFHSVDGECDRFVRPRRGGSIIDLGDQ